MTVITVFTSTSIYDNSASYNTGIHLLEMVIRCKTVS